MDRTFLSRAVEPIRACDGVTRVIVAGADGLPYVDDSTLGDRERGAASVAALMGVVELTAQGLGVDGLQGAVIHGVDTEIIAQTVNDRVLLVVVTRRSRDQASLYREVQAAVGRIASAVPREN
ncbi:roadblock/LC7 domain-containing protein [Demequina sediminicola]|uniref:roadblock/LC7 domain-containing protein n=1 Tax=Demequina sediminicola TaxID=1095026 RepID=UPI00078037BD|nr:roadblock/LC7 domain-containing protein [Demequina sediminicola]